MLVIVFAFSSPYICLFYHGYLPSLSSYWKSDLQPLFIIANAATSYYLFSIKRWWPSAICLLILTAFSVELFPKIHNITAVVFFLMNLYPLLKASHYKWIVYLYLTSVIVLPFSMLFSEIIAINSLCLYHGLLLNKLYKLQNH